MKRLPFERAYLLESTPCPRCAGSGVYAAPSPRMPRDCWNCRGLGRTISRAGRELFSEICLLLGHPVEERESRIAPRHLEVLAGEQLRTGMRVTSTGWYAGDPSRIIATIDELPLDQRRLTFTDGYRMVASALLMFFRELTDEELDRVDALMAARIGTGAVEASELRVNSR